jgi:hypothetical protein
LQQTSLPLTPELCAELPQSKLSKYHCDGWDPEGVEDVQAVFDENGDAILVHYREAHDLALQYWGSEAALQKELQKRYNEAELQYVIDSASTAQKPRLLQEQYKEGHDDLMEEERSAGMSGEYINDAQQECLAR